MRHISFGIGRFWVEIAEREPFRATSPSVALAIARTPATCVCPPGVLHLADCARVRLAMEGHE